MDNKYPRFIKKEHASLMNRCIPPDCGEVIICELSSNTFLSEFIHGYDLSNIQHNPIKMIKIGDGSTLIEDLNCIIILDDGSYFITSPDRKTIYDYITSKRLI